MRTDCFVADACTLYVILRYLLIYDGPTRLSKSLTIRPFV